jgi:hypothetical protein
MTGLELIEKLTGLGSDVLRNAQVSLKIEAPDGGGASARANAVWNHDLSNNGGYIIISNQSLT